MFAQEAGVARGAASDARSAVSDVADQLVTRHALALLTKRNELAKELETIDALVLSFEQFASPRPPRRIAEFALGVYASGRGVALLDQSKWRSLRERLTENAEAPLEL